MDHLTLDDIIEFVSLVEINDETMQLISTVNTHIAECGECRALVRSFQTVYDELARAGSMDMDVVELADGQVAAFSLADLDDDGE